ncbi:ATP-binding protein [Occallatibacter savannae]|uniref:ATP-binding protein n=1 Tax=Occallatibacter savannae TaxID=1002691 RepID=UPI0013A52D4D|nr:ATP-binding protein [Occallatibacter savannae]
MSVPILQLALQTERDVVQARQRAREVAAELGLDNQDQIRLATATSEIARNAFRYAGNGKVAFSLDLEQQRIEVEVSDSGAGIPNLEEVLEGRYRSMTGMGMGIIGTQRLMDHFEIETSERGTKVRMGKALPRFRDNWTERTARELKQKMRERVPSNPFEEIEQQNQELLKTLQELRTRQEELELLNRELEDTNRGVVALYAELDERADYLRRASELKTKFLSNVSHEFRTPLNSIISLARMLMDRLDGDLTGEQLKQIRYIESSARVLQDLVNDLLDLAKVEAGKVRMRPKRFEIHELFSALKGMLKPLLADNTSVSLIFDAADDPIPLRTDEGKVSQILRNLISNAIKFTPNGSVTVSATMLPEQEVEFRVADTGIGIAPEHHETIFKEFSQVDNPLQDKYRGTGLGLPLCRNLAKLLGGSIWLESEAGKGSTFFVRIPAIYVGEKLEADDAEMPPAPEYHRAPVLIVEDNAETARLLESHLRNSEFQAIIATNVAQAEIWTARHAPVAVIADVYLEEEVCWGFLERIRERWPDLVCIASSASDESAIARENGVEVFLQKPVERDALLRELRSRVSQTESRRILLVDDNEIARYILRDLLDQPWLNIREASNGTEAFSAIEQELPDAIILDILMPDMSGFDVLRKLRTASATERLPVLIYTSKDLSEAEQSELATLNASIIKKAEVSSRLSAKPFLEWAKSAGISPEAMAPEANG